MDREQAKAECLALAVFTFFGDVSKAWGTLNQTLQQIQTVYGPLPVDLDREARTAGAPPQDLRPGQAEVAAHSRGLPDTAQRAQLEATAKQEVQPQQHHQQQKQSEPEQPKRLPSPAHPATQHLALLECVQATLQEASRGGFIEQQQEEEKGSPAQAGSGGSRESEATGSGHTPAAPCTHSPTKMPPPLFSPLPLKRPVTGGATGPHIAGLKDSPLAAIAGGGSVLASFQEAKQPAGPLRTLSDPSHLQLFRSMLQGTEAPSPAPALTGPTPTGQGLRQQSEQQQQQQGQRRQQQQQEEQGGEVTFAPPPSAPRQHEQDLRQEQRQEQRQPGTEAAHLPAPQTLFHTDSNLKELATTNLPPLLRFLSNFSESAAGSGGSPDLSPDQEPTPTAAAAAHGESPTAAAGEAAGAGTPAGAGGGEEAAPSGAAVAEVGQGPPGPSPALLLELQLLQGGAGQQSRQHSYLESQLLRLLSGLSQHSVEVTETSAGAQLSEGQPAGERRPKRGREEGGFDDAGTGALDLLTPPYEPPGSAPGQTQGGPVLAQQQQQQTQQVEPSPGYPQPVEHRGLGAWSGPSAALLPEPAGPAEPVALPALEPAAAAASAKHEAPFAALLAAPALVAGIAGPAAPPPLLSLPLGSSAAQAVVSWCSLPTTPLGPRPGARHMDMGAPGQAPGQGSCSPAAAEAEAAAAAAAAAYTSHIQQQQQQQADQTAQLAAMAMQGLLGAAPGPASVQAAAAPGPASHGAARSPVRSGKRQRVQRGREVPQTAAEAAAGPAAAGAEGGTAAAAAAAGAAGAEGQAAAYEGPPTKLDHVITRDTSRLGSWAEEDKQELVRLVQKYHPCGASDWEAIADKLGRWSRGGASAERMYRTLTDPGYHKATNKHGRRLNPRRRIPMHVMACFALRELPGHEGNLSQIASLIKAHPLFGKELDFSPRPGTKTYPRWKDALVGCFKRGRYAHLIKTAKKEEGLSVYRLDPAAITPAIAQELAKYEAAAKAVPEDTAAGGQQQGQQPPQQPGEREEGQHQGGEELEEGALEEEEGEMSEGEEGAGGPNFGS